MKREPSSSNSVVDELSIDARVAESETGSVCSGVTGSSGMPRNRQKVMGKAQTWRESINVHEVMESNAHGREIWQAGQTLSALERTHPGDVQTVLLKEHLSLAKTAQDSTRA
eukprot:6490548-Amphidinium_carterae.3